MGRVLGRVRTNKGETMNKKANKKQADRDLEHFLDGQRAAMEMVQEELFDELVEIQETVTKALAILGDKKRFIERKNRELVFRGDNLLD